MSDLAADVVTEHGRIADLLDDLAPDAPGGVGDWTASDLAAHLMWQRAVGGLFVLPARVLLARGVRLNDLPGASTGRLDAFYRRKGFGRAVRSVRKGPPRLLLLDSIAPIALFEVWLHHDDLRRANHLAPPAEPASLDRAVDFALRYQRKALGEATVDRTGSRGDLLRWLAGRPSSLPAHSPPLRF